MIALAMAIQKRIDYLLELKNNIQLSLRKYPKGKVRVSVSRNHPQYYLVSNVPGSSPYGRYIRKQDEALAKKLCQKEYDTLLLKAIDTELDQLDQLAKLETDPLPEKAFSSLPERKQILVSPRCSSFDIYADAWLKQPYEQKSFDIADSRLVTNNGVQMRSKSELLIASRLEYYHIPYKYEKTLYLSGITFHPDFTILNPRTYEECYWEHMGMMDDPSYATNALHRLDIYQRNGLFLGDRLFISYETNASPLDLRLLDSMLDFYFL